MATEGKLEFTKQMRKATREIHDISDALVNAKLGIGICINEFIISITIALNSS